MFNGAASKPILTNVAFINNWALGACGGGIINYDSSPMLTNVTFSGNHGNNGGGCEDGDVAKPATALTAQIVALARDKGLILLSCGSYGNVLRFLMPLTVPDALLDRGLAILAECFDALD